MGDDLTLAMFTWLSGQQKAVALDALEFNDVGCTMKNCKYFVGKSIRVEKKNTMLGSD